MVLSLSSGGGWWAYLLHDVLNCLGLACGARCYWSNKGLFCFSLFSFSESMFMLRNEVSIEEDRQHHWCRAAWESIIGLPALCGGLNGCASLFSFSLHTKDSLSYLLNCLSPDLSASVISTSLISKNLVFKRGKQSWVSVQNSDFVVAVDRLDTLNMKPLQTHRGPLIYFDHWCYTCHSARTRSWHQPAARKPLQPKSLYLSLLCLSFFDSLCDSDYWRIFL